MRDLKDWMNDPLVENVSRVAYVAMQEWRHVTHQAMLRMKWAELPLLWKEHVKIVVARCFVNMEVPTGKELHQRCYAEGVAAGWTYSDIIDTEKKQHPDVLPWEEMSQEQRITDHIMSAIIKSFLEGT